VTVCELTVKNRCSLIDGERGAAIARGSKVAIARVVVANRISSTGIVSVGYVALKSPLLSLIVAVCGGSPWMVMVTCSPIGGHGPEGETQITPDKMTEGVPYRMV